MMEAHVSDFKKGVVKEFTSLIDKHPIIGAVNMENLPARQLTGLREKLRGTAVIKMTKRRLMKIAIEDSKKPGIEKLEPYLKGMPALLFTDQNPFTLFKTLKKNKSKAPIKAGQTAPNDIVVPAGPTSFAPGPIIGELGALGIKTGVEAGKVAVKQDSKVAKEGDVVSDQLAGVLSRLGIEPMEVGLNLVAVYEEGGILTKEVLDVDEEAYLSNLRSAASESFSLAINIAYAVPETIELLIAKSFTESKALAMEAGIMNSETVKEVLAKAEAGAAAVKSKVPDAPEEGAKSDESGDEKKDDDASEGKQPEEKDSDDNDDSGEKEEDASEEEKTDEKKDDSGSSGDEKEEAEEKKEKSEGRGKQA